MSPDLSLPGQVEMRVQKTLRELVKSEIDKRQLSVDDVAKTLDLLPSGAQALLERQVWSIETALRVAERLWVDMEIEIRPKNK